MRRGSGGHQRLVVGGFKIARNTAMKRAIISRVGIKNMPTLPRDLQPV